MMEEKWKLPFMIQDYMQINNFDLYLHSYFNY